MEENPIVDTMALRNVAVMAAIRMARSTRIMRRSGSTKQQINDLVGGPPTTPTGRRPTAKVGGSQVVAENFF